MSLPRFTACAVCGRHGRIEHPDGRTPEACSQEAAQWRLMTAVAEGHVPLDRVEDLYYQIESSKLPVFDEAVDPDFAEVIRRWNERKNPDPSADFHQRAFH